VATRFSLGEHHDSANDWGFAYGFVDTLNKRFEKLIGISTEQYIGLHAAYFGFVPLRGASRA